MSYSVQVNLSDLVRLNPPAGKRALRALLKECDGKPTVAAVQAEVSHATMKRWISMFDLRGDVERYRAKAGLAPARTEARALRGQIVVGED